MSVDCGANSKGGSVNDAKSIRSVYPGSRFLSKVREVLFYLEQVDNIPAVPIDLAHDPLVRRGESRQISFSQSTKCPSFPLLPPQCIVLHHVQSLLFQG